MRSRSVTADLTGARCGAVVGRIATCAALASVFWAFASTHAAGPGGAAPSAAKSSPVKLESVVGSNVPRVILTAKAAERLGIETGKVGEAVIVRKQIVGGIIVPPQMDKSRGRSPDAGGFGGFGKGARAPTPEVRPAETSAQKLANVGFGGYARTPPAPEPVASADAPAARRAPEDVWVYVTLSPAEWERLAPSQPARMLPVGSQPGARKEILARPSGMEPEEDRKRLMLRLFYVVPGTDHGLAVNDRVRVELELAGNSDRKRKVVPYGAVLYDAKGEAWVYVNTDPLTFERRRIVVERIEGDLASLSDGPTLGTPIVTVGAALLYGSEIFKK